jgi:hypothetical protein
MGELQAFSRAVSFRRRGTLACDIARFWIQIQQLFQCQKVGRTDSSMLSATFSSIMEAALELKLSRSHVEWLLY